MRVVATLVLALLLGGCEHLYGSMDAGRLAPGAAESR
jgi:hypothetical protein